MAAALLAQQRIGIHKSALLRYFETREQIFLELTAAAWRDWAQALSSAGLDAAAPGGAALVADVFARSFADRPLFCDLIAHTPLNLERNVSPGAVRRCPICLVVTTRQHSGTGARESGPERQGQSVRARATA